MGAVTDSIKNYDAVVQKIRDMAISGRSASEILNFLVDQCGIKGKAQLIILFCKGFDIELKKASCIGGWWVNGEGELSDDRINELLNSELFNYNPIGGNS